MYKKILSLTLILAMACGIAIPHIMPNASERVQEENNKVTDELLEVIGVSYEDVLSGNFEDTEDIYSCIIWMQDIDMTVAVKAGIDAAEKTRPTYTSTMNLETAYSVMEIEGNTVIDVNFADDESDLYIQTYIDNERAAAVELYAKNNVVLLKELIANKDISVNYVSSYSPCIFADLTIAAISELIMKESILSIGCWQFGEIMDSATDRSNILFSDDEKDDLAEHLKIINAINAKNNYGVTGAGVKIGQIESGCPNKSTVTKPSGVTTTVHAYNVHTIMSTVALNASYYANQVSGWASMPQSIEWLISQGVNIINMSAIVDHQERNSYKDAAKWVDHIMYNHDVHFVICSGNYSSEMGVVGPAMGYNVITVGNTKMDGSYMIHDTSLYNNLGANLAAQRTYKPDLCAPGTYASTGRSGTSYSTPLVTGAIALMCEYQPSLKTKQQVVKAILAATTGVAKDNRAKKFVTSDTNNFMKYGAGIIDVRAALWVVANNRYSISTGTVSTSADTKTYSMAVTSSDSLMRVALAYANRIKFDSSLHTQVEELDGSIGELRLDVISPSGIIVAYCVTRGANLKVVEFVPSEYGTYTIRVMQTVSASDGRATNFGVAWR